MMVKRPPGISSVPTSHLCDDRSKTGERTHLCRETMSMCQTYSRRVRPEETSVLTQQSCFAIANSSTDEFASLCDDTLRGGIREHQHDKQKDDMQTATFERRGLAVRTLRC